MPTTLKPKGQKAEVKREYVLAKRDGTPIRCLIPGHYTVQEAKGILAERAGYEPNIAEDGLSVRLAVETDAGSRLLPDEMRFRDLEEGLRLKPIPSLAPARV
ncbi:MAG: hypothetical protein ABSG86_26250 [Thermoguttaceae bacterium]|jgi:hypothetical protein